jgi:hypothetical protein
MCALVVAARKFGNPDLKVPEGFEDAARVAINNLS